MNFRPFFSFLILLYIFINCHSCNLPLAKQLFYNEGTDNITRKEICVCPEDYIGPQCSTRRKYTCSISLLKPIFSCEPLESVAGTVIDSDPVCLRMLTNETLYVDSKMSCFFTEAGKSYGNMSEFQNFTDVQNETIVYPNFVDVLKSFQYFLQTDEISFSNRPVHPIQFRVVNFNSLSDDTGTQRIAIHNPKFWIGQMNIQGILNISQLFHRKNRNDYFPGNRMYCEFGFLSPDVPQGMSDGFESFVVDFDELLEPPAAFDWKTLIYSIFGTIVALFVTVTIMYVTYLYMRESTDLDS